MAEQPAYRHGISLLHELKYPHDFEHFEHANPQAPKGGELKLSSTTPIRNFAGVPGTGVPGAQGLGRTVDRLMIRSADALSGLYGQLADCVALSTDRRSLFIRLAGHNPASGRSVQNGEHAGSSLVSGLERRWMAGAFDGGEIPPNAAPALIPALPAAVCDGGRAGSSTCQQPRMKRRLPVSVDA